MKRIVGIVALSVCCSTGAFATIVNSKHDFGSGSTSGGAKSNGATPETQTCKFCHVPHGGISTETLLWSHNSTAATTYTWGATTTAAGTTLPTAAMTTSAKRCLSCHDGTIAVGSTNINGTTNVIALSTAGNVDGNGYIIGTSSVAVKANAMAGNHPVSIPYPGSVGLYNAIQSKAVVTDYQAINSTGTGCTSTSGICVGGTNGAKISLARDPSVATAYGVECTSCHNPHGVGVAKFLVVDNASSNLCTSCHIM